MARVLDPGRRLARPSWRMGVMKSTVMEALKGRPLRAALAGAAQHELLSAPASGILDIYGVT